MDEKERQEIDLEDIIKEFREESDDAPETVSVEETEETETELPGQASESAQIPEETVTSDTIRLDTIRLDPTAFPKGQVRNAEPLEEDESPAEVEEPTLVQEPFSEKWEPEYEQPIGEYVAPQPIRFQPRSRLRELKRQLVAGPEKRYYALSEKGLGKIQTAIFFSLLVALLCAGATVLYACGMIPQERQRLMVFGQFFGLLLSALFGCYQMLDGIGDVFRGRFGPNTLLAFTFVICCVDGVFCLQNEQVPCCAAFSLQVTMSLWGSYQRRNAEISQMDTMRKATRLDSVVACPDYFNGRKGLLRGEGQVAHFMDTYDKTFTPDKVLSWYCLLAFLAAVGLGVTAWQFYGVQTGIRVGAVSILAAMPASTFITVSRPFAILQKQLHRLGTVICGWQGVKGLNGRAAFPLSHEDLYPIRSVRMNGVKFYGSRLPDEILAYTAAVVEADGGGLVPLFNQLLDSRNGYHLDAKELCSYDGGVGGTVEQVQVLVGSISFLKSMDVEVPEGIRVSHAVCAAIDGQFSALFALNLEKVKSSAVGMTTLCAYRGLIPVVVSPDFMLTGKFIRSRYGVKPKRIRFPEQQMREQLRQKEAPEDAPALLLTTTDGLAPLACGVTGARALRTACGLGVAVHILGGLVGLGIMLALVLLQAMELLTPVNMFLYQLVWLVPGLLLSEWTRTI